MLVLRIFIYGSNIDIQSISLSACRPNKDKEKVDELQKFEYYKI